MGIDSVSPTWQPVSDVDKTTWSLLPGQPHPWFPRRSSQHPIRPRGSRHLSQTSVLLVQMYPRWQLVSSLSFGCYHCYRSVFSSTFLVSLPRAKHVENMHLMNFCLIWQYDVISNDFSHSTMPMKMRMYSWYRWSLLYVPCVCVTSLDAFGTGTHLVRSNVPPSMNCCSSTTFDRWNDHNDHRDYLFHHHDNSRYTCR